VLVAEAYDLGKTHQARPDADPWPSWRSNPSFNPFAQSHVGAQGLMQVMTRVHGDKYESFGGKLTAFDPVTNLRVGVKVLQECIQRAGSLEGGLRYYVGAANLADDGGYANKVLAEHERLQQVAAGRNPVPVATPLGAIRTVRSRSPSSESRPSGNKPPSRRPPSKSRPAPVF
jgi:hypothetical protein